MFPFSLRGTTPSVALIPFSDSRSREVLTHPGKMHPVSVQLDDTPRWLWRLVWERSCIDTSEEDQFPSYGAPFLDGSAISCSISLHLTSEPMSLLSMSFLSIHFYLFFGSVSSVSSSLFAFASRLEFDDFILMRVCKIRSIWTSYCNVTYVFLIFQISIHSEWLLSWWGWDLFIKSHDAGTSGDP